MCVHACVCVCVCMRVPVVSVLTVWSECVVCNKFWEF